MSNGDWYARKLAQARGQSTPPAATPPAPGPAQYPPTQPLAPGQLPPHLAPYAQQVPQAPQQPQQPQEHLPPAQQQFTSYNAETGAMVADDGHVAALVNAAATGGSKEVKEGSSICPNCGGGNYFTVAGGVFSKVAGGKVSPMQCADCNYPAIQAGSTGGALGGSRSSGPAKAARQLPAGHRVTVLDGSRPVTFDPPTGAR